MRIIAVYFLNTQTKMLKGKTNLSFISMFKRPMARIIMDEYVSFAGCSLSNYERKIFEQEKGLLLCYRRGNECWLMITDLEYPTRVSFELLQQLSENYSEEHMQRIIDQCQDPSSVDSIYRVQRELDETMVIMHENISKLLERGHRIDELVDKTEQLSDSSVRFYKAARQHNRCCIIS